MNEHSKPVVIELADDEEIIQAADAPPLLDEDVSIAEGRAMQTALGIAQRRPSPLARWFVRLSGALVGLALSVWAWDFATSLLERAPYVGYFALALLGALAVVLIAVTIKELSAIARLKRIGNLQNGAKTAIFENDLSAASQVADKIQRLYQNRADLEWGLRTFNEQRAEKIDASELLAEAERNIMAPLDSAALTIIETNARHVAAATALVPLALADVAVALFANIRMIRRIAEIYGGQSGSLGTWRLARNVIAHLVATGAVAVGDDLIGSVAGGGLLSKLSRRFGEGMINGALTARVGIAAIEVCRPLPFSALKRPSISGIIARALTGLFTKGTS